MHIIIMMNIDGFRNISSDPLLSIRTIYVAGGKYSI